MQVVRKIGQAKRGIRIDRIVVDGMELSGGIVVATSQGRSVEVTTVLTRPKSAKAILKLLKENSPRITAGVNVEWLQSKQSKIETIAERIYRAGISPPAIEG